MRYLSFFLFLEQKNRYPNPSIMGLSGSWFFVVRKYVKMAKRYRLGGYTALVYRLSWTGC